MTLLRRVTLAGVCAVLAALAAVAALADPHTGSHGSRAVLALDRSASIDANMRATEARWVAGTSPGTCAQPCRVVTFGAQAQTLPPGAARAATSAGPAATDLEAGVEAAVAAAPRDGRAVVLSDGEQTAGDASAAVAAARARGVAIDAVMLADSKLRDAALTRLSAPSTVHQGDTISLLVTVTSTTISPATLYVTRDGRHTASQVIQLHKGDNPFTLSYTAAGVGWHSFKVRVLLVHDQRPQNNALTASVDVGAPPRVIVASTAARPAIAQILAARGAQVAVAAPAALPRQSAQYAAVDSVVLDDIPASALSAKQISALGAAVHDGGLGLLTLGGKQAYSLGGYAHSPLDRLLPVASLVPGDLQRRNLAIELVLDRSGSMADLAGGARKITMAQTAARETAQFVAKHRDELGIVDFDIAPHLFLSMQRVTPGADVKRVSKRIGGLRADGGTDIYLGLQSGLHQLLTSKSPNRHMILLTDGISQPHNYSGLLRQLSQHKIAVATVALGNDVDSSLLRSISTATGGNAYATSNARDLPKIFVKETRLSAKPVQLTGRQQVLPQGSSPVVRSLAGKSLPPLTGNVVTKLRAGAQVDLVAHSGSATTDPALAQWGYGSGRVVSWTPGIGAPWATRWASEAALWNDAVRWVDRGATAPPASASASEGTAIDLQVDLAAAGPLPQTAIRAVLDAHGGLRQLVLRETAPSIYTTTAPRLPPGSYGLTLGLPAALGGRQRVLVDVPYAAEYLPTPLGESVLAQLAEQTGGRLLSPGDPGALAGSRRSLQVPLLVLAALLYLLSIAARLLLRARDARRGKPPGSPPPARPAPELGAQPVTRP